MAKSALTNYKKWLPHNLKLIKKQSTVYLGGVKKNELVALLKDVAEATVSYLETGSSIPVHTGNLHDATGVGVYVDGVLTHYIPTKIARSTQSSGFHHRNEYNIDGQKYLQASLSSATSAFSDKIWIVIFSAVPYAFYVEDMYSYFSDIKDYVRNQITTGLVRLKPKYIL